jgi:hypothetical protein
MMNTSRLLDLAKCAMYNKVCSASLALLLAALFGRYIPTRSCWNRNHKILCSHCCSVHGQLGSLLDSQVAARSFFLLLLPLIVVFESTSIIRIVCRRSLLEPSYGLNARVSVAELSITVRPFA